MAKNRKLTWKGFHRWVGLVFSVFILVFCISGILLNHREAIAGCDVNRSLLPSSYHIRNYNNGILKGTLRLGPDSILVYGNSGLWLTDNSFAHWCAMNEGLPTGADRRNVRNVVRSADGAIWAAAQYDLFRHTGRQWTPVALPGNTERVTDVTLSPDSTRTIALTRSKIYSIDAANTRDARVIPLQAAEGHSTEVSLFKTIWLLHSGGLFGITGRIIVDTVAVVIIFLCFTGIVIFIVPHRLRAAARRKLTTRVRWLATWLKWNVRWHDRAGYWLIALTLLISVTGMCLRPPLMIPLVLTTTEPLPYSTLDNDNPWHDRLRAARFDDRLGKWLISTSEGFVTVDAGFKTRPVFLDISKTPPVSPMGINVFERDTLGRWIVGSFSGMFRWDPATGEVTDYFTGKKAERSHGRPVAAFMAAGYTAEAREPIAVDYAKGTDRLGEMPAELATQPMSLWNTALELHVGRCYNPFLGPLSDLFVFIAGLLLTLILISGLIIHRRHA